MKYTYRFRRYITGIGARRLLFMLLGNIFLSMGVGIFKISGLGNDPFNGMNMALAAKFSVSYPLFQLLLSLALFAVEFAFGRSLIGVGTIVNALLLGYFNAFFYWLFHLVFEPGSFLSRLITMIVGVIVCSFGISLYQTSDAGVAPYDSLAMILDRRLPKIPYFWCRIFCDGPCALVCFLAGGIVGLGTLTTTFGFGPVIHFFNKTVSEKMVNG